MSSKLDEFQLREEINIYERDFDLYKMVLERDIACESQELDLIEQIALIELKLEVLYAKLYEVENRGLS